MDIMDFKGSSLLQNPIQANTGYGGTSTPTSVNSDSFSNYLKDDQEKTDSGAISSIKNYAQGFLNDARSVERDVHEASLGLRSVESVVPKVATLAANTEIVKGTAESLVGAAKAVINMQI